MTENKPKKKQGWEYAQEAKAAKRAAAASGSPIVGVHKPQVKATEHQLETYNLKVSTPDTDFGSRVVSMNFLPRAGVATYADELKQRLLDLGDLPDATYFLLPVKLPKKVYKQLLEASLFMAAEVPDWTERDMLEAIVIFSNTKGLTSQKG